MNELISVIIPVYKVEAYLTACVESVLAQTYRNIEVILVDDGSPDNCPKMCDEFAAKDSRIRVIHKENEGVAAARNDGIAQVRGKYFAFLDSDDLWSPLFLERMYHAILETGADFSVCLFQRFHSQPPSNPPEPTKPICMTQREGFECLFSNRNIQMVAPPNKLYKRKLFNEIRYPTGLIHEDEAAIHEIIGESKVIAWIDEVHYYYREAPNSITTAKFSLKRLDETYAKEQRITFFENRNMHDLADKTRIVYLNNLMRLHRTVLFSVEDSAIANTVCKKLHARFCEICKPGLLRRSSLYQRTWFTIFRYAPVLLSYFDYYRLKRKGII